MKLLLLIPFFILCVPLWLFAQQNNTGALKGQVTGPARKGIGFASATLLRVPDSSLVGGAHTEDNGRFEISGIAPSSYILKISYLGYVTTYQPVNIAPGKTVNTGVIILQKNSRMLNEVVVESSVPDVQYELDKTVFNITKDIEAMSTNATEILEQIPMVELDEEGVPSVMGQSVTVLIDGRPSKIYGDNIETVLKLIPAGTIEKVEVITNPSARYTTEQGAIVLNIITKTKHLTGLSGIASFSANTNGNYSPALSVNLKRDRFGWNNSFSFDYDRDPFSSSLLRKNMLDKVTYIDQTRNGTDNDKDFGYNTSIIYNLTEKSSVGAFFGLGHDTEKELEKLITRTLDSGKQLVSSYTRDITGRENSWQYRTGLNYKRTFSSDDHVLEAEAYYSTRRDKDDEIFDQKSDWHDHNLLQHQYTNSGDKGYTIDIDYVQPFTEKSRLEAGFRGEWETDDNNFIPKYFDEETGKYLINDTLLNDYTAVDREFSLYAMYRTEIKNISLQAGARLEKENQKTKQNKLDQLYDNDFLNLIPTLNFSYRLKNKDNISFSYSRRANRPWWRQLSPFIDYSNPENIESGNPDLKPEFINSFELRYGKFINQFNLFGSLFYRHSYQPIQRISTVNDQGVSFTTYENVGKENYYGLETGFSADIIPQWNVRFNIGLRKNEVLGFDRAYQTVAFNGRFSTFFPLPAGFRGYLYLHYRGPRSIAQGRQKGMLLSDLGVRRSFLNERAELSLRLSDLFNQRQYSREKEYENFTETSTYQRESRYLKISLSYLFGKLEAREENNKGNNSDGGAPEQGNESQEF